MANLSLNPAAPNGSLASFVQLTQLALAAINVLLGGAHPPQPPPFTPPHTFALTLRSCVADTDDEEDEGEGDWARTRTRRTTRPTRPRPRQAGRHEEEEDGTGGPGGPGEPTTAS